MSRGLKNRLVGRWARLLLVACLLAGGQRAAGQALPPVLRRTVAPTPGNRPLGAVLAELSRQSGLPFSYSSSLVPMAARCELRPGSARPLGEVLREVLGASHLTYGLLDGQLVLWPDHVAAPPNALAVNGYTTLPGQPAGNPLVTGASAAVSHHAASLRPPAARANVAARAAQPAGNARYLASGTKKDLTAGALSPATGANPGGRLAGRPGTVRAAPQSAAEPQARAAHGRPGLWLCAGRGGRYRASNCGGSRAVSIARAGHRRPRHAPYSEAHRPPSGDHGELGRAAGAAAAGAARGAAAGWCSSHSIGWTQPDRRKQTCGTQVFERQD